MPRFPWRSNFPQLLNLLFIIYNRSGSELPTSPLRTYLLWPMQWSWPNPTMVTHTTLSCLGDWFRNSSWYRMWQHVYWLCCLCRHTFSKCYATCTDFWLSSRSVSRYWYKSLKPYMPDTASFHMCPEELCALMINNCWSSPVQETSTLLWQEPGLFLPWLQPVGTCFHLRSGHWGSFTAVPPGL